MLFLIDLENPENDIEIGSCNNLRFECFEIIGDTGYGQSGHDGYLYTIDLSTNVATQLPIPTDPECPPCYNGVCGLASDESGMMYGGRPSPSDIIEIDPMTGENLGVVFSGLPEYITSLAYGSSGNLWSIPALGGTLYSIDLNSGTYTAVVSLDIGHCTGLTTGQDNPTSTEESSWGAVKSLYR